MKILIAADMEGISGVVDRRQVSPGQPEYSRFCAIMTQDVNAAVSGAFEGGADEVVVTDGHWFGTNILFESLHPRARLNSGLTSPLAMVEGVQENVDGVLFIGYHGRAGSLNAVLDHTWSSVSVGNVWLNDILVGESGLNAALCSHYRVPVLMLSGDQTACGQAVELLGPIETAVVKQAHGRQAADCLPLLEAQERIRLAAAKAVKRLVKGDVPPLFLAGVKIKVGVEFLNVDLADRAALYPMAHRVDGRKLEIESLEMPLAYNAFRTMVALANS